MKKLRFNFWVLLSVLAIVPLLTACNSDTSPTKEQPYEETGVPKSVVLNDLDDDDDYLYVEENISKIDIQHAIDPAAHIDTVAIQMIVETDYARCIAKATYQYEYNKASDLWSLVDYTSWEWDKRLKDFSNKSPISGEYSSYGNREHTLFEMEAQSIDSDKGTISGTLYRLNTSCGCNAFIEDTFKPYIFEDGTVMVYPAKAADPLWKHSCGWIFFPDINLH